VDHEELVKPSSSPQKSDASASQSSDRRSRTPRSKPASKSKKFHSGTLKILSVPSLITEESQSFELLLDQDQTMSQDIESQVEENSSFQSYMDVDSQATQDYSYPPLQTQAPYQSQDLSQF
jgi:hypothetical protein